jgi:RND family efflux transporter MFP subunit
MGDPVMRVHEHCSLIVAAALMLTLTGCRKPETPSAEHAELPTLDVTSWTDRSELFMEHPPFVAGRTIRFAVHLTALHDFSAVHAGRPRIEMTPEAGGTSVTIPGTPPLRPGVFRVEGPLPPAGRYRWALIVDAPDLSDRHDLGVTTVFADEAAAVADAEKSGDGDATEISYLKEQQWTNPFTTVTVREADLRGSIRLPARIRPVTGGEAIVSAPAAGRFSAESVVSIGAVVREGQVLGRLEPRLASGDDRTTLAANVAEAESALDGARMEQQRAERLVSERAVPARRLEEARRAVTVADVRLQAAQARLAQRDETLKTGGGAATGNAYVLRAPLGGKVVEVMATRGASYEEGAPLFRLVKTNEVELQALVPAADVETTRRIERIALEIPGREEPIPLRLHHQHDSGVIDPDTHALTVQFEVDNAAGGLLIGQTGTAILSTPQQVRVPAVPRAAVLMEAGRPYVFVQTGGETFSRRFVDVAAREGDVIGVKSGIKPGERVVVRGAYDVQLASAAKGLPAEGHVH